MRELWASNSLQLRTSSSGRWHTDIKVPLIYTKKTINYILDATVIANGELVAKSRTQAIPVNLDIDVALISYDLGTASTTIKEHVQSWVARAGSFLGDVVDIDLVRPGLRLQVADTWLACEDLRINLTIDRKYYLKCLTPAEYSQVRDHRRDTTFPLHLKLSGPSQLDESFIQVPSTDLPVKPLMFVTLKEWTDIERAQGKGQPTGTQSTRGAAWVPPFIDPFDRS